MPDCSALPPPADDPEEIIGEASVHACRHGRIEVVRWFLDRGVDPDADGRLHMFFAAAVGGLDQIGVPGPFPGGDLVRSPNIS
jgi:hypothetical protein